MGLKDMFSRGGKKATLPRNAKVVRRQKRRGGGSDLGYWEYNTFYLLDGSMANSYEYDGGENSGTVLSTEEARAELNDHGYDGNDYTAPSTSSYRDDTSYDPTPTQSYDPAPSSYTPSPSYEAPAPSYEAPSYSPSPSYDSSPSPSYSDPSPSSSNDW